jgi:putative oxidoreductase
MARATSFAVADTTHVVMRIGVGLLFMQHGLQKFGVIGGKAPVVLTSLMGVAGILELAGGALLVAGLLTRPVAVVLALQMAAAYVMAHHPKGGWPLQNGGELPLLFAMVFVFLAGNGAGRLSLDRVLRRRGSRGDTGILHDARRRAA